MVKRSVLLRRCSTRPRATVMLFLRTALSATSRLAPIATSSAPTAHRSLPSSPVQHAILVTKSKGVAASPARAATHPSPALLAHTGPSSTPRAAVPRSAIRAISSTKPMDFALPADQATPSTECAVRQGSQPRHQGVRARQGK